MQEGPNSWERATLNKILMSGLKEQRATRYWGIFFKILFFVYLLFTSYALMMSTPTIQASLQKKDFTAVIGLNGVIANDKSASSKNLIPVLRQAFAHPFSKGVIIKINSPGGSPVQSSLIHKEMLRLKQQYPDKKLIAVIEDAGASGAYWIASGADEVYADATSIVGSIGVVVNSFGFTEVMKNLGIERRLYTAGKNKGMLDAFSPENEEQVSILEDQLKGLHNKFIEVVKKGRGEKLSSDDDVFSGRIFMGYQALELGLIDGLLDVSEVAKDVIKAPNTIDMTPDLPFFNKFKVMIESIFIGMTDSIRWI